MTKEMEQGVRLDVQPHRHSHSEARSPLQGARGETEEHEGCSLFWSLWSSYGEQGRDGREGRRLSAAHVCSAAGGSGARERGIDLGWVDWRWVLRDA